MRYRSAVQNRNAEFLLRLNAIEIKLNEWPAEQSKDDALKQLCTQLQSKDKVSVDDYLPYIQEIKVKEDGTLTHLGRVIVPIHLRTEICKICHSIPNAGHFAEIRTLSRIKGKYRNRYNWRVQ